MTRTRQFRPVLCQESKEVAEQREHAIRQRRLTVVLCVVLGMAIAGLYFTIKHYPLSLSERTQPVGFLPREMETHEPHSH